MEALKMFASGNQRCFGSCRIIGSGGRDASSKMSERSIAVAEKAPVPLLSPVQGGILQRQCACGQHTMGGECEACKKKKMPLQRKFNGLAGPAWAIVHEVLRSPGQELDAETRRFMEQGFKREVVPSRVVPNHRSTQP